MEETNRPSMAEIPSDRDVGDALTREELESAVGKLSNDKAVGPDGVPVEVFKYSVKDRDILHTYIVIIKLMKWFSREFCSNKINNNKCLGVPVQI